MTERAYRQFCNSNPDDYVCKIWWEYNPNKKKIYERYNLVVKLVPLSDFNDMESFAINNKFQIFTCYETGKVPYSYMWTTKEKISYYAQYLLKRKHKDFFKKQQEIVKELKKTYKLMNDINYVLAHWDEGVIR